MRIAKATKQGRRATRFQDQSFFPERGQTCPLASPELEDQALERFVSNWNQIKESFSRVSSRKEVSGANQDGASDTPPSLDILTQGKFHFGHSKAENSTTILE
jgi:hypothetical protein